MTRSGKSRRVREVPTGKQWGHPFVGVVGTPGLTAGGRESRLVWSSPVFEGVMGPVVEIQGLLVGHHQRRLTAVDAATGEQLWRLPNESDGQIVAYDRWLVFVNDRAGRIELLAVDRQGANVLRSQTVIKPTRMETPLTVAGDTLFLRSPGELVALRLGP